MKYDLLYQTWRRKQGKNKKKARQRRAFSYGSSVVLGMIVDVQQLMGAVADAPGIDLAQDGVGLGALDLGQVVGLSLTLWLPFKSASTLRRQEKKHRKILQTV